MVLHAIFCGLVCLCAKLNQSYLACLQSRSNSSFAMKFDTHGHNSLSLRAHLSQMGETYWEHAVNFVIIPLIMKREASKRNDSVQRD